MTWLARFQNMVKELEHHPEVVLLDFHVFEPIAQEHFFFLEKKYDTQIPESLKKLYRLTNGLQLRWIFKKNENFSPEKYQISSEILSWDFFQKTFRFEDGGVMLLPLEDVLENKIFDAFNDLYSMNILDDEFNLTLCEEEITSENSSTTDIDSYLEFLLAGKGLISRRAFFYQNKKPTHLLTPISFWKKNKILNLDNVLLKNKFQHINQLSYSENQINHLFLWQNTQNEKCISQNKIEKMLTKHQEFLMSGGAGGRWKVIELKGLVTAFYENKKENSEGSQANFERMNISEIDFANSISDQIGNAFPFSNFCSSFAARCNFSNCDLSHSLFSDAFLQDANFSNSKLTNTDFSRADLQNANFKNADLTGCDFENCNLKNANFENAKLDEARFPGAVLY